MAENTVCDQTVRFTFPFFEKRVWSQEETPPLDGILHTDDVTPEALRELGDFLCRRLQRIASMAELLREAHPGWRITGKKDRLVMETKPWDFEIATALLKAHGFTDDEYVLDIEYERKWGTL